MHTNRPPRKDHRDTENSEKKDGKLMSDANRSKDIKSEERRDKFRMSTRLRSSHKGNIPCQTEQKPGVKKMNITVKVNRIVLIEMARIPTGKIKTALRRR